MRPFRPISLGALGVVLAASALAAPTSAIAEVEPATATITGTVLDDQTGTPIPTRWGALLDPVVVVATPIGSPRADFRAPLDAAGNYTLTGLTSGQAYIVTFSTFTDSQEALVEDGDSSRVFPWKTEYYNDTRDRAKATPVIPTADAPLVINAGLARFPQISATKRPKIIGARRVGKTLKVKNVGFNISGVSVAYRWYVGGRYVGGTRGSLPRMKLKAEDRGKRVHVVVEARKPLHFNADSKTSKTGKIMKTKKKRKK